MDNINFKGAFLIKNPTELTKLKMGAIAGSKKQIFENFNNTKDVLYVLKDTRDYDVAKYLYKSYEDAVYYPDINTKSGLDVEKPHLAIRLLEQKKDSAIRNINDILIRLGLRNKFIENDSSIENILKTFNLNFEENSVRLHKGYTVLYNRESKREVAKISKPGRFGLSFVEISPKTSDENPKRYAINKLGEKVVEYKSLAGTKQFIKNFSAAVKYNEEISLKP